MSLIIIWFEHTWLWSEAASSARSLIRCQFQHSYHFFLIKRWWWLWCEPRKDICSDHRLILSPLPWIRTIKTKESNRYQVVGACKMETQVEVPDRKSIFPDRTTRKVSTSRPSQTETAYEHTFVRSKLHLSRLSCFHFFPGRVILNARRHLVRSFRSGHIDFWSGTPTWE